MANTQTSAGKNDAPKTAAKPRARKRKKVDSMMARPWKPENEGDCIEGIYHGMETVPGKGKRRPFSSYHIELYDPATGQTTGERVRVASAMLNSKLNQVPKGAYLWLTFKGMFETSNGDSPDYEVEVEEGTDLVDPLEESGKVNQAMAD